VDTLGRVDILVNNAGMIRRAPLLEHPASDWDDVLAINLDAVFHLSRAAAKRFVAQGSGKIINIASMLSFQGGILVPGYTASKHAVAGLTKAFANELAVHGVNVNAIAPGYMATDNTAQIRADEAREKAILGRIPAGRWGTPADMEGPFVFLASPASNYLNGAIIPVDGGWLVR
jgi:2-deoxy-D-gluconate 3-dehydrogenase